MHDSKTKQSAIDSYFFLGFLFLYAYPLFNGVLGKTVSISLSAMGFIIVFLSIVSINGGVLAASRVVAYWIVIAVIALVSHLFLHIFFLNYSVPIMFLCTLLFSMCISTELWVSPAIRALLLLLSVHLVATLLLFIFPELYPSIKTTFFANAPNAVGYKSGLTTHYSQNAHYLLVGVAVSSAFFFRHHGKKRVLWGLLAGLFFFAILLTTKRAHLLCAAVSILANYLTGFSRGNTAKAALITALLLMFVLVLSEFIPAVSLSLDRFTGTFDATDLEEATTGRVYLWNAAVEGWRQHPFIGNGWGTFYYVWADGFTVSTLAHNELLQLIHDTGIVGAVAIISLEIACLVFAFNTAKTIATDGSTYDDTVRSAISFGFSYQFAALLYGYSSGILLQSAYVFLPYFIAISIVFTYRGSLTAFTGASSLSPESSNREEE